MGGGTSMQQQQQLQQQQQQQLLRSQQQQQQLLAAQQHPHQIPPHLMAQQNQAMSMQGQVNTPQLLFLSACFSRLKINVPNNVPYNFTK